MKIIGSLARWIGRVIERAFVAVLACSLIAGAIAYADYNATQGTGTSFASLIISGKHYMALAICDATLGETRCATILASGSQQFDTTGSGTLDGEIANPPCPTGAVCYFDTNNSGNLISAINAPATLASQYPSGAVKITGSATGTTTATATTLAATSGKTNFLCGFSIRANANAAATNNSTVADGTTTLNFTQWTAPNTSGLGITEMIWPICLPASGTNIAWTATSGAPGTGGVVSVSIWGYQL